MDQNDGVPVTAPAYLTKEACDGKFQNLVNAVNSIDGALEMMKNDPGVLRFREETVVLAMQLGSGNLTEMKRKLWSYASGLP